MDRPRLSSKQSIEVLQVGQTLADVLEIVICGMISIQVKVFAVSLFTREQKGDS